MGRLKNDRHLNSNLLEKSNKENKLYTLLFSHLFFKKIFTSSEYTFIHKLQKERLKLQNEIHINIEVGYTFLLAIQTIDSSCKRAK